MHTCVFQKPLLLTCCALFAVQGYAKEERNVRGNFAITFPGKQRSVAESGDYRVGAETLSIHTFSVQIESGVAFTLMYVDYPKAVIEGRGCSRLVASLGKGVVGQLGGVPTAAGEFDDGELKGQQISFHGKAQEIETAGQLRLFLVENRLYQLLVWGSKEGFNQGVAQEFFGSFKLLHSK